MSNFSENLAMIVKNIGCDYEKIDKSYSGEQITELYLKEYEKGRKYGYTPVILSCDDSLAEILEINSEDIDAYRNKLLSMNLDYGREFLRNRFKKQVKAIKKYFGSTASLYGDFDDTIKSQMILENSSSADLIIAKIPTLNVWEIFAWIPFGGWNECPGAEDMMAVCKYWYQLYKAVPAIISGDTLQMYCFDPVKNKSDALKLAEEQYGFCNDIIDQGMGEIKPLASLLTNSTVWSFWWD